MRKGIKLAILVYNYQIQIILSYNSHQGLKTSKFKIKKKLFKINYILAFLASTICIIHKVSPS